MPQTKAFLRKIYLEKRTLLSETEKLKANEKIHFLLFSRLMMHRYDRIHIYLTAQNKAEPETNHIINTLLNDFSPDLYVPKMDKKGQLAHYNYPGVQDLVLNKFGIPEPNEGESISSEKFFETDDDILLIIPLLAFDKKGYRVGYGGGFYDRFLQYKTPNTTLVGLSFFGADEAIEDLDEFDIPLNFCITPDRVYSFKAS